VKEVNQAFAIFSNYIDVNFRYYGYYTTPIAASTADSQINFSLDGVNLIFKSSSVWAIGNFPTTLWDYLYSGQSGDIYLNIKSEANFLSSYAPGSNGFALLLHELGHTLGLKHTHDDGGTGHPTFASLGENFLDQDWFSIMSYNDTYRWNQLAWNPATPLALDVLGLMSIYGPNLTTNAGDDVHTIIKSNVYSTLWDAGGTDTLNLINNTEGWTIYLQLAKNRLLNIKVGLATTSADFLLSAPKNITWLLGDYENVVGTKYNDVIRGNENNNIISGLSGNDAIDGSSGVDTIVYFGTRSQYSISVKASQTVVKDLTSGRDGTDTLTSVEFLKFSDQTVSAPDSASAIGIAIADQLSVVYLGRGINLDWRSATAGAVSNGASDSILRAFFSAAVADRAFGANDSIQTIVNKTFFNIFGISASAFEQNAWAGTVNAGYVSKEALPWAMFNSYLGATNVPISYQIPAQSRIIAANAFTNAVNGPQDALLGGPGAPKADLARAWLLPIRSQEDAAAKVLSASATVSSLSGVSNASGPLDPLLAFSGSSALSSPDQLELIGVHANYLVSSDLLS
jgi:hypothetical protein